MSDTVKVEGLKLNATASDGLLITDTNVSDDRVWATSKNMAMPTAAALSPTNTLDGTEWVKAESADFDDENSEQLVANYVTVSDGTTGFTYTQPTAAANTYWIEGEGIGSRTIDSKSANYVLLKNFWIKSSGNAALAKDLTVESVTATLTGDASADANAIYRSLRVLFVVTTGQNTDSFIYAPVANYDNSIKFKNTTELTLKASNVQSVFTHVDSIPIADADAVNVKMYMYFEGEDDACKSSNVSGVTLNGVEVSAIFGTAANNS